MPVNGIHSRSASEGGFTITQTEEHLLQERISYLSTQVNALNQLLNDCRRHRSRTETGVARLIAASTSGPTASRDTSTEVCQPRSDFVHPDDKAELPPTPSADRFPSFPVSPFTANDGHGRDYDAVESRHSKVSSFHSLDRPSSLEVARPLSASESVHGLASFPVPQGRTTTISGASHQARASTSTPPTSPQENEYRATQEEQIQYDSLIEVQNLHCFNRVCGFNRSRVDADALEPGEPYTRELIAWPTEMDSLQFLNILECALRPHARACDRPYSTDCQTCVARIDVQSIMTKFLTKTLCTGESMLDIRDRWYPNDDWLTVGVEPQDQHFVRLGMLLVYECICDILKQNGIPDPRAQRTSMALAPATHARRPGGSPPFAIPAHSHMT